MQYAVKDVMDLELTPLGGEEGEVIVINYLNSCTLTWDEESVSALEKGAETMTFTKPKTGEFKISAQVIKDDYFCLATGGVKEGDKIKVKSVSPSTSYKCTGIFTKSVKNGKDVQEKVTLHSVRPIASGEMTLSGDEIATFDITFKIMSVGDDFIDFEPAPTTPIVKSK